MTTKSTRWIRRRHTVVRNLLYWPLYWYVRAAYHIELERRMDDRRAYLILFNHQTAFDQFFVSLSFRPHVYYVSSEDLFSNGWLSRLITWLVAPIPFRKSTSDLNGVKNCLRIAREGGCVAMAPEGNRTYSGTTEHMKQSVASLAKALKLPLALYRIEGGYGVHPRWADKLRRGKMRAYVSRILEPEEIKEMSAQELFDLIYQELWVDERQDKTPFYSRHSAEYLDRAMYYCPHCGLSVFSSRGEEIWCTRCGLRARYLPDKTFLPVKGSFPYENVKQWYDAQCDYVRSLDLRQWLQAPMYQDFVQYRENKYCDRKRVLAKKAVLSVYGDRFTVAYGDREDVYPFRELSSATVLGRNKLNLYTVENRIFQFNGDKHFNALKYLNLYFHATHKEKENGYGEFLGL